MTGILAAALLSLWIAFELAYAQALPVASITSNGDVAEGTAATFTVSASPTPWPT